MPYLAKLEKAGIPTVVVDFADQTNMVEQEALVNGVPRIRYIHASRTLPGEEDVVNLVEPILKALTKPLTRKEKTKGKYEPPPQQRILFEGTLDEAQSFYQQTKHIPRPVNAPIAVYTDGLPVIVPTEERVREMLTGTSHKPDELITHQFDRLAIRGGKPIKKGDPVQFQPMHWIATVEKVATIAVMAGCKPEHLPVVLAIAESSCGTGTTTFHGQWTCISGPIVKQIGMNVGCGMLDPGNPANMAIGRTYELMAINLGGAIPGVNRMNSIGTPLNRAGTCFAENEDGLPPGWKGLNEEYGFGKNESLLITGDGGGGIQRTDFSPGGYRAFQKSGHGGMARRLDIKGMPGPHNWLEFLVPEIFAPREGGMTLIMVPELARHLYECGFKSKEEVYEWLWEKSFEPLSEFRKRSRPDHTTNGWLGIEKTSGKRWKELADDYMVPTGGDNPFGNCIIVGGGEEEVYVELSARHAGYYSIDAWR